MDSPPSVHPTDQALRSYGLGKLDVDFPTNGERRVNGYSARSYSSGDL